MTPLSALMQMMQEMLCKEGKRCIWQFSTQLTEINRYKYTPLVVQTFLKAFVAAVGPACGKGWCCSQGPEQQEWGSHQVWQSPQVLQSPQGCSPSQQRPRKAGSAQETLPGAAGAARAGAALPGQQCPSVPAQGLTSIPAQAPSAAPSSDEQPHLAGFQPQFNKGTRMAGFCLDLSKLLQDKLQLMKRVRNRQVMGVTSLPS